MDIIGPDQRLQLAVDVDWLSFSGEQSENLRTFIQGVHKFAFAHGRQSDGVWMADYVYGCLSDDALKWFDSLDAEVQRDWSKLKPAMIEKFMASKSSMRCRIKVVRRNGGVVGYLSPPTSSSLSVHVVPSDEALLVDISEVQGAQPLVARIKIL
ncbi:hypothetical protein FRB95_005373 [Tulasnella sp. JGI-2019a]|nr:hypothetical protein FRB95_005373 [Tulasnella sp. JGI-2019a]